MDSLKKFSIIHAAIDVLGYYGGNYGLHKLADTSAPKMRDTAIFGISDLLVRNFSQLDYLSNKLPGGKSMQRDSAIAILSFVLNSVVDSVKGKEISKALVNNAIKNGIGFGTNMIIDKAIPKEYI